MTRLAVAGQGQVGRRVVRMAEPDEAVDRPEALPATLGCGDVVILAVGGSHARVAADLVARGISVVSVTDDIDDVHELLELHDVCRGIGATLVVGAGMAPGLSGLLARYLSMTLSRCDEIHIAFHATAGPACARQHHRALAGRAVGWHDGAWIERPAGSGRELCWFPEPVGARDCYRAQLPDPLLLHGEFPEVDRISARVSATRRDRLTARLPMLRPPHGEGGIGALRVEVRGTDANGSRATEIVGIAEFVGAATAATASALARSILDGGCPPGAITAASTDLDTRALLGLIESYGVRLQEFTGVPQTG